jgi:DNA-binding NtrC family response regulator
MSDKPRILHIEDTAIMVELVANIIGSYADISTAANIQEAMDLLSANHFDLVILDLTLPDGSGLDLVENIKKGNPGLPILIHSAHEVSDNIHNVDAVISKSYMEKENFLATIKRLIKNKTPVEE